MPRIVTCGLTQVHAPDPGDKPVDAVRESPRNIGEFYGTSYFCDPRGRILSEGSRDSDELVVAALDLDQIEEVRTQWQFFRDRRPEAYGPLAAAEGRR